MPLTCQIGCYHGNSFTNNTITYCQGNLIRQGWVKVTNVYIMDRPALSLPEVKGALDNILNFLFVSVLFIT